MLAVTGADGFVGRALCREAQARGIAVLPITRRQPNPEGRQIGDIGAGQIGPGLFAGVDSVVHCAARVHVMDAAGSGDLEQFRRVNRDGAVAVARAAAAAGVRRFVFLSTAKVLGERTTVRPFRHDDPLAPADPYATSKAEAEVALRQLAGSTSMELVIARPPLVHGPGAAGNLALLARLIRLRVPLPLRSVRNRRAVLGVDNLVDALLHLATAPAAAGEVVLLRDEPTLSTPEIVTALGRGLGVRVFLLPLPEALLRLGARLVGREEYAARVLDSLELSLDHTERVIGWSPRLSASEGLQRVGRQVAR